MEKLWCLHGAPIHVLVVNAQLVASQGRLGRLPRVLEIAGDVVVPRAAALRSVAETFAGVPDGRDIAHTLRMLAHMLDSDRRALTR